MRLITLHGRKDPAEDMKDWGFNDPDIEGVKAIHWTYGNFVAHFETAAHAEAAQRLTGWQPFDDAALEMSFQDDLLKLHPAGEEAHYFGDWELQDAPPQAPAHAFIAQIARMTPDGEGGFVMENDDAVDTVNSLIRRARELLATA